MTTLGATSSPVRLAARGTVLVGGGPAGSALLLAASRHGGLDQLLGAGLTIIERGSALGAGALGSYAVTSDSTAGTFLTAIRDHGIRSLARLMGRPESLALAMHGATKGVQLTHVGAFLAMLGQELGRLVEEGGGDLLTGHEALHATREDDGWLVRVKRLSDGTLFDIPASNVVVATGGQQNTGFLCDVSIAGEKLGAICKERLVGSDEILSLGGLERLVERVNAVELPRIAIVGGSTSAVTAANLILNNSFAGRLGESAITLLHRRPLRPFYPSQQAAREDGYSDFGPEDICPLSGFVYRLAGFRTEARELVLSALGVGGRTPDARLFLHRLTHENDAASRTILDEADIVIAALGYRPRSMNLLDELGRPIDVFSDPAEYAPMVDATCRMLDASRQVIPGMFGIGLAAGFVPSGPLGGEPSFRGQANGLWLWQNAVGAMITEQLCSRVTEARQLTTKAQADQVLSVRPVLQSMAAMVTTGRQKAPSSRLASAA